MTSSQFYLASRSPRRAALLRQAGLRFALVDASVPEIPAPGQSPADYARTIAAAKARAGVATMIAQGLPELPVLGADTDVSLDGEILGKPQDAEAAVRMLLQLSERTHEVCTAVAIACADEVAVELSLTRVHMGRITREQAMAYWQSGEPADKAGAYAIQGTAARWVRVIEGSYTGVVGLPLYETLGLLARHGVDVDEAIAMPFETFIAVPA